MSKLWIVAALVLAGCSSNSSQMPQTYPRPVGVARTAPAVGSVPAAPASAPIVVPQSAARQPGAVPAQPQAAPKTVWQNGREVNVNGFTYAATPTPPPSMQDKAMAELQRLETEKSRDREEIARLSGEIDVLQAKIRTIDSGSHAQQNDYSSTRSGYVQDIEDKQQEMHALLSKDYTNERFDSGPAVIRPNVAMPRQPPR